MDPQPALVAAWLRVMPHIRLIHWNGPEGRALTLRLTQLGHTVDFDEVVGPGLSRLLRTSQPDAFVIDLSRLPSHGREVAMWLRTTKSTRHVPIVFVDGDPEKVAKIKTLLPDATYTTWARMKTALPKAIARPVKSPVVPPSHIYTGRSTVEKLGVKSGMRVGLVNAPQGFVDTLGLLPDQVRFTAKANADCDLIVAFVRSRQQLDAQLIGLARAVDRQTLWLAWPKKASGVAADLNGNIVRESGLAAGWVDFKVCAIDDTWSGLAFKRRQATPRLRRE